MDPQNPDNQKPTSGAGDIYPSGQANQGQPAPPQTAPLYPREPQEPNLTRQQPELQQPAFSQNENPLYQTPEAQTAESYPEPQITKAPPVVAEAQAPPVQEGQEPPEVSAEASRVLPEVKGTGTPVFSSEGMEGGGRRLPIKKILTGLIAVILLGGIAFAANTFFFSKKAPIGLKEPVTLTYWGLWEDSATIGGLISEYEAQHKGVKIDYVRQSKEDYRERLANSLAKGGPGTPDIFRLHNTWVPMLSSQLASLPPAVLDPATYQKTFYPIAVQDLRRGTEIVGIPLMFDGLGLYVNEGILKSAGKSPPANWDELRKLALELTVRDAEGNISQAGAALGRTDNVDHWEDILALMMIQNGADLGNPTGKLAEDSLAFFTIFSQKDKVWDETLPPSTQAFAAGKLAMYFGPSWRAFEIKTKNPNLSFRVVPVPQLPKAMPDDPDVTWASYWAEGVWVKSKAQKEAWEFLKFLSSRDSLQKLYQAAATSRLFGPPYPVLDMAALLEEDPVAGAYVKQAPAARSWYLASRTFDGQTGINSRISAYFSDGVNAVLAGMTPKEALDTVAAGVKQVLANYKLAQ